ncbi:transglycosylase SLT domain-containing protein [Lepagella muris]|jgi:membrane-bound lytic murein transglycosylase F|uniref:Transporter substrate-binding domain-containing protein n=1 Tax=Lepagella muris TaxID=3032870 RepID=A0AC61RI46_9BACT|nr:transglycosylase SLT domain-containing protein [Lepagella muris]ROT09251.1 lytic transglycosylase F [Muribaculaceae bacterium Isolate-037 (Harlan)]TGY76881.1 transporter substrate-binding domain-containing protein [Lepagella muris]THG48342.1 transporter substrate-binding domain-containing protein [Bacteroidales bacterium]TKC57365.1 transporter substrate-binding domain-containing protein [Bacteroidales bacterium]
MIKLPFLHISLLALATVPLACGSNKAASGETDGNVPDTLHAATLYGPTSYFSYRGQTMGFDYENVKRFAEDENLVLDLKVAPSLNALLKMLENGEIELAAYPIPIIEEYNKVVRHCGYKEITWQVLVQPHNKERISDVTGLVGKDVYVESDSKYYYRLKNLDQELGGGINIVTITKDSLITEDLIRMVDRGEIPLTVVDSDIAELNKSYYPRLDIGMKISLDQFSSWAVRNDLDSLASKINNWEKRHDNSQMLREIYKKYFEISKSSAPYENPVEALGVKIKKGKRISNYDATFRRHAKIPGYDWRLLASIGFNESSFNNDTVSWAGAKGLMQLMPATAKTVGVEPEELVNPERCIFAAASLLKKLDLALAEKVPDPDERQRFVVAAYNCGLGHIYDAIALAEKYGLDSKRWIGNVSEAALMKSRPKYYNDKVVKNGYFRGRETVDFVDKVFSVYDFFIKHTQ